MKKVIFVIESMNIGGTEKALLSMISEIPKNRYDMTILLLENQGGFLQSIPSHVEVKVLDEYIKVKDKINKPPRELMIEEFKGKKYFHMLKTIIYYGISRITNDYNFYFNRKIMSDINKLREQYNVAISYQGPPSNFSAYYVAKKIKSKKKIQWIHSDVSKLNLHVKTISKLYKRFDRIFVVSKNGKDEFIKLFPSLKKNTEVFYNIISPNIILGQGKMEKGFEDGFSGTRILTVGRLSGEKGQGKTIPVLARLKNEGYKVRWYCIGEGVLRKKYEELINEYDVSEDYILMGNKTNPYPYFEECDIYVQPSRFEGYCITLAEARMFKKPIITTNFTGANEQIVNNETGLIVQYEEEEIYVALKALLDSSNLKYKFINNLSKENFNTNGTIEKLYSEIDSV